MKNYTRLEKELWFGAAVLLLNFALSVLFSYFFGGGVAVKMIISAVFYVTYRIGWNIGYDRAAMTRYEKGVEDGMRYAQNTWREFLLLKGDAETYKLFIEWNKKNLESDKEAEEDEP